MRLLTLDRLPAATIDAECGPSKFLWLMFAILLTALAGFAAAMGAGIIWNPGIPSSLLYCGAGFLLVAGCVGWTGTISLMRSDRYWLVRVVDGKLWIRCAQQPGALVVELEACDLEWAQPCQTTYVSKGWMQNEYSDRHDYYSYLELGLAEPATALLEHFAADETIAKEVREQVGAFPEVYTKPVRMIRPGVLRLYWTGMSPRLGRIGQIFSPLTEVKAVRREKAGCD